MFPLNIPIEHQLLLLTAVIEKILQPPAAAQEVARVRNLVATNGSSAHTILTDIIRTWRIAAANAEAARIKTTHA